MRPPRSTARTPARRSSASSSRSCGRSTSSIIVVTVIESLRAFDIVYIINKGKNGLELLSIADHQQQLSEASLLGFGSAIAVVLLVISLVPIVVFLTRTMRSGHDVSTSTSATAGRRSRPSRVRPRRRIRWQRVALHAFLIALALVWLFPIAVDRSTRPSGRIGDTIVDGYVSFAPDADPRQLRLGLGRGRAAALLPEHADHRRSRP